ncbi:hypothetical protein Bpfe_029540 [Biomphalaria pfeifferi]|uniref:Uncharacterized protein n=1 Tax=Biomphalaria pfeifferi TaxID=112525 RepID=A0AAD8ARC9_BIOPF|nr:hypothetical protein Bpfe_029540 [Biomphalaria pfeifferi]
MARSLSHWRCQIGPETRGHPLNTRKKPPQILSGRSRPQLTSSAGQWSFTLSLGDLAFDRSCRSLTAKLLELMDMGGVAMVADLKVGSGNHLMKQMCL